MVFLLLMLTVAAEDAKRVELQGTLRTGINAIGGETTGTIIETKAGVFELDLRTKELRQKAGMLDGKEVCVEGTLTIRKGVEVPERKIINVSKLGKNPSD